MPAAHVDPIEQLPAGRRSLLLRLKERGFATTHELAKDLGVTHEAIRRQLVELVRDGFVKPDCEDDDAEAARAGRPPVTYCLTTAGEHFFPKRYDDLVLLLLQAAGEPDLLARLTELRLEQLEVTSQSSFEERMNALGSIYLQTDPFFEVARDGDDSLLIEKNCPFLNVALERPELCSTTVSAMRTLLGCEVGRERTFQEGHGRCVFRVFTDRPVSERRRRRFEMEPPPERVREMRER